MRTAHRLLRADRRHRTGLCRICGPAAIRRRHLVGRWRWVKDSAGSDRRQARERETLELAQALMRTPRPPF